ncbi:MAG: hypothetical protein COA42_18340 [Alteromonadaceae bacterium]|nr:MAG: hypothetical protein COA42_18340 [Alteromonadaceae bacterium]
MSYLAKIWMFSNGQSGARDSAMIYSIIETVKVNGIETFVLRVSKAFCRGMLISNQPLSAR